MKNIDEIARGLAERIVLELGARVKDGLPITDDGCTMWVGNNIKQALQQLILNKASDDIISTSKMLIERKLKPTNQLDATATLTKRGRDD